MKQTYIQDLSSYFPLGRQVIIERIDVEPITKSGLSIGEQTKYKLIKKGKEVKELDVSTTETDVFVVISSNTPMVSLFDGTDTYLQLDAAYILGIEILAITPFKEKTEELHKHE